MELQPVLRPRVATLAAKDLWEEEQGMIPPERRAYLEVVSWGRRPLLAPQQRSRVMPPRRPKGAQGGRMALDWCVDLALMLVIVGALLHPVWMVLPVLCLALLAAGVLSL